MLFFLPSECAGARHFHHQENRALTWSQMLERGDNRETNALANNRQLAGIVDALWAW